MVNAVKLLRAFNGNYITYRFNHTNHFLLAHGVVADMAKFLIGNIKTAAAEFYFVAHFSDYIAELTYFFCILLNKMQYQTQRRFFTNTWQFGKFIHSIFQKRGRKNHVAKVAVSN